MLLADWSVTGDPSVPDALLDVSARALLTPGPLRRIVSGMLVLLLFTSSAAPLATVMVRPVVVPRTVLLPSRRVPLLTKTLPVKLNGWLLRNTMPDGVAD